MVGKVISEELNVNELQAGVVAVLVDQNRMEIITIKHINQDGDWVIMGQGFDDYAIPLSAQLCRLVIVSNSGTYPLKYNQWSNSIRSKEVNSDDPVTFELVPQKFKEGIHVKVCHTCTAQFMGTKSQSDCMMCCTKNVTAKILINKKVKPKRPRMVSQSQAKELAKQAYDLGKASHLVKDFDTWLNKQF